MNAARYCPLRGHCPPFADVVSSDGTGLAFLDNPADQRLSGVSAATNPPPGTYLAFTTSLVGIDKQRGIHPLYSWTWNSTFNGTAGGVSQTSSVFPVDPGSGTGGVTLTSINGVRFPSVISSDQVTTTASGLAYSRITQTFNGTVTISNISNSEINGPLQIVFFGMPADVTMVNATANISGTPYLTVPTITGLMPGQSATIDVQFKNPSNTSIKLTPTIYSGSIN